LSRRSRGLQALAAAAALVASTGCWEQWSVWWWPQMKWQKTVQAFEETGKAKFATFCSPCHGLQGLGDGPVAGPPWGKGPFVGVLPLAGPAGIAKALTDGHIFTTISQGRGRMPSYKRIPADDRWDIINYVRTLSAQPAPAPAQTAQAAPGAGAPGGRN